jgi:hypothetical protein
MRGRAGESGRPGRAGTADCRAVTLGLHDPGPPANPSGGDPLPPRTARTRVHRGPTGPRPDDRRTRWESIRLPLGALVVLVIIAGGIVVEHRHSFDALAADGLPVTGEVVATHRQDPNQKFDHTYADLAYDWAGTRHRARLFLDGDDLPRGPHALLLVDPGDPGRVMIAGVRHRTDGYEVSLLLLGALGVIVALVGTVRWRRRRQPVARGDGLGADPPPGARGPGPGAVYADAP